MTEQTQPANGTVAEEAARLIEAMASMARSSTGSRTGSSGGSGTGSSAGSSAGSGTGSSAGSSAGSNQEHSSYAGGPAEEPSSPGAADDSRRSEHPGARSDGTCSACGGERDSTPVACRLCPLCQGIALLRSVRPETVDRLADFASAVASSLRDVATQSRAAGPTPSTARPSDGRPSDGRPSDGRPSDGGRATVQDIQVDDEDEG